MDRYSFYRLYICIASVTAVLFLVPLFGKAQSGLYYRSIASGNWSSPVCWEVSANASFSPSVVATFAPDQTSNTITIQNGHTITIISSVTIDEVVVDPGGTLILSNTSLLSVSIANGTGTDLLVNGTLQDNMFASVTWASNAKWSAGALSTFVKTSSSSVNGWQTNYENGIATIPATHQWIYRKQTTDNPTVSIASAIYGNLSFDNVTAAFWDATAFTSKLTGSVNSGLVKGKLTIGDNCKIYLENSAATPLSILGDFEIKTLGVFVFNTSVSGGARGIDLQGNLTVTGSLLYDLTTATDLNRLIQFSGTNNQIVSSPTTLSLYNVVVNKLLGKVTLSSNVTVTNILTLTLGLIDLNAHTLHLSNGNATALVVAAGGVYAEDVLFQGKFSRVIGQGLQLYLFPFTNLYWTVGFSLISPLIVNNEIVITSTYKTGNNNLPLPYLNGAQLSPPDGVPSDVGNDTGDRYWLIDAPTTLSVTSLTISFWPLNELNTTVLLWDMIQNKTGAGWDKVFQNNVGPIFVDPLVTNIAGVWTVISHNVPLGFKQESAKPTNKEVIHEEIVDIDVYSLEGKWLKNYAASTVLQVTKELNPGLYFLRVIHSDRAETLKIGVQ